MALSIKDPAVDKNLRLLASMTGESLTQAAAKAIEEKLAKLEAAKAREIAARQKKMMAWLAKRKPVKYKDNYDHKKVTDALWEL